jgi:cellulose synthase/poly-beta-1,6-N-acetylglucosamine synthase-like glycosyltransferase
MKFSIIITYLKEGSPEVLDSIKQMNYPKSNYEVLCLPGPGSPSIYRNKGGDQGRGEIIAFIDDDAIIHRDLLVNAEKFFNEHPETDIVGGPQLTPLDERGFAKISGYALSSKFGGWNTSSRYERKKLNLNADETYLTTAVMFCKKDVFKTVKFDENIFPGEDSKFVIDAKKAGLKVAYSPDLIVYHRRRPTIKKFVKQIFNYGKFSPLKGHFSEIIKKPFFLAPSVFLVYFIALILVIIIKPLLIFNMLGFFYRPFSFASLLFVPLLLYIVLDLLFSVYESLKNKHLIATIFLPFIFPIIHMSYGAGMIYGHLRKFKKK